MTEAMRAHMRLMESTPTERVHTHHRVEVPAGRGFVRGRTKEETERLHHSILALKRKGLNNKAVARELRISAMTVSKHLRGLIKAVK